MGKPPGRRRLEASPARGDLERGRASFERRAWGDAQRLLARADEEAELPPEDLELLATAAYMLGRDDEYLSALERAHHRYLENGRSLPAVRCAFWVGMNLAIRGEIGPASGWLGRAQRLLEREDQESVERGYLLIPRVFQYEAQGEFEAAAEVAAEAAEIAERFGDAEGYALAIQAQGYMQLKAGRVKSGLALLDEAMVAAAGGKLSPIMTGFVYCAVILACQEVYELRRAQEWTSALARWCDEQPDLVAFTGRCLIHRAEIMQLRGSWGEALAEARRAGDRLSRGFNRAAAAQAFYRQGEVLRLQGEFAAAEAAYRDASRYGWEPQPGMALLRLAQEQPSVAEASIQRALAETTEPLRRANLLPAYVEIMLAAHNLEEATTGSAELGAIAEHYESDMLAALVGQARGAVELAAGDARTALRSLRDAGEKWRGLGAPYDEARVRVLVAEACRALGDEDTAALELQAARDIFVWLGATPDLERLDGRAPRPEQDYGLTRRQLEVLRLVAAGQSNREIAAALIISEHTVARHVQNIFTTLGVSTRTAASAFAYEHGLL